jgi:amino acid permease
MLGIVLCTFASSDKVLEQGMAIRNIIWALLALVLFFAISCQVSEKHTFITSPIFLVFIAYLLMTAISLFKAINVTEGYYEV